MNALYDCLATRAAETVLVLLHYISSPWGTQSLATYGTYTIVNHLKFYSIIMFQQHFFCSNGNLLSTFPVYLATFSIVQNYRPYSMHTAKR